ncbi:MAG: hypothetical protein ABI675_15130 [Chitinophagaceae bacterium]
MENVNAHTATVQDEFTLEEKIKYGIIGLIVLGSAFFIGRGLVRKARSNDEQKKTYDDDNPAAAAQKLKLSFDNDNWFGWGTDEDVIREVLKKIRSKDEFDKVIKSYQRLYSRSLMDDMQNELTTAEYAEMVDILSSKPDKYIPGRLPVPTTTQYKAWARRLRAAFKVNTWGVIPYGTDEDAIREVFIEVPTQAAFLETAKAYSSEYGDDLIADLKSELSSSELKEMNQILEKKPRA